MTDSLRGLSAGSHRRLALAGVWELAEIRLIRQAELSCLVVSWMAPMLVRRKCVYVWFHCAGEAWGRIVLCPMNLGFARSVVVDADCLGQLCQGKSYALVYPFDCA